MEPEPPADHSYVNWRIKATYSDDSTENFPQGDWYKTWSTCYYDDGSYGGIHADGDGCDVPAAGEESEGFLQVLAWRWRSSPCPSSRHGGSPLVFSRADGVPPSVPRSDAAQPSTP